MAGPNFFDQFDEQPAADPIVALPDPYKAEDQEFQRRAAERADAQFRLAQEAEARQAQKDAVDMGGGALKDQKTALEIEKLRLDIGKADPKQAQAQQAQGLLTAAGVDLARGIDPVADLIRGSTSGGLQSAAANAYGFVTGDSTSGMENIGKLKTIASDLTLQMTGGSLGAQVSNTDRDFIVERVGNIADPSVPASQRLAAWEQVKARMAALSGQAAAPTNAPTVVTTEDAIRGGAQTRWGDQEAQGIFDRANYLESLGIPKGGEARLVQMWNQMPPEATVDYVKQSYEVNGIPPPSDEAIVTMLDDVKAGRKFEGVDTSRAEQEYVSGLDAVLKGRGAAPETASGAAGINLAQGATLGFGDEVAGIGGAIRGALTGTGAIAGYQAERDIIRREQERAREARPVLSIASELGGGLISGGAGVRSGVSTAMQAGRRLQATGQQVNRAALAGQMARQGVKSGAAVGALAGYGTGEGLEGSIASGVVGAGLGGALGALGGKLTKRAAQRGVNPPAGGGGPSGRAALDAADALGITVTPAVTGGKTTQMLTSGAKQGFISAAPLDKAVTRMTSEASAARSRIADNTGTVLDRGDAGEVVRSAAKIYSTRTSQIGGRLYERADRLAGGVKLPLPKAVQSVDEEMAQLAKAPGGTDSALYKEMASLKKSMEGGAFEVDGIRALRTRLRNEISAANLRGSPQDVTYQKVLRAAEEDMIGGLIATGDDKAVAAAKALRTASDFWRKRVETIDEVLNPVLGKQRSGEQIIGTLEAMAKERGGNAARLRRLMRAMPKDEAASVRASVINNLGRAKPGDDFSFATFQTQWRSMSAKAKDTMFDDESRAALDRLATVAERVNMAGESANFSNTVGSAITQGFITLGTLAIDLATLGKAAVSQYAAGKLLASPRVARALAGAGKDTPAARKQLSSKLLTIARAEPALAADLQVLSRAINQSVNDNNVIPALAAEEQNP